MTTWSPPAATNSAVQMATLAVVGDSDDLLPEASSQRARRISVVTRRDLFDYLRGAGGPWHGDLEEPAFLSRLYDLDALPSTDTRYATAAGDIMQHRIRNYDWDDDWVLTDERFRLAGGPDEVLLGFLSQRVHPIVERDTERAAKIVAEFNRLLRPDGWTLKEQSHISGRPVYAPSRIDHVTPAVDAAHAVAARIDDEYIAQMVTRMEAAVETAPDLAIGTAKEFVETICKTILDARGETYDKHDDVPRLVRLAAKALQLTPDDIADTAKAAKTIKVMLSNLATLVQGSVELRNTYGTGHGRSAGKARPGGLTPRHARLAVGSASTLGVFLYETHETRS